MRFATSEGIRRACVLVLLAALTLQASPRMRLLAEQPPSDNQSERLTAGPDAEEGEPSKDQKRRSVMRRVAWAALCMILLLSVFIVVVMIMSRRMRIRYLGWDRRIKFNKLWDVWWHRSEEKPDEKNKPDKR